MHAVATRRGAFPTGLQIYFCEGHRQRRIAALLREFDAGTRKPRPRRTRPAAGIEAGGDVPLRHLRPVQQGLDARQRHLAEQSRRDVRRIERWYLQEITCIGQILRPGARQACDLFPERPNALADALSQLFDPVAHHRHAVERPSHGLNRPDDALPAEAS